MPVIAKQFCLAKPKGSSVYFTSKQILPFGFSGRNCDPYTFNSLDLFHDTMGGGPRVVVSTAAFHARVRGLVPGLGGLKETNNVSSPSTCESQYCGEPP